MALKPIEHYPFSSDPAFGACAVSKSDTVNIVDAAGDTRRTRGLYVGGSGNVRVKMADGADVIFYSVPAGTVLPIQIDRVYSTNTTATLMTALF